MWPNRRGTPVDRHYAEAFLERHCADIRGRVLEMGSPGYTRVFGGGRVTRSDVLDIVAENRDATVIGDLAVGDGIPSDAFDCFILTQTLSSSTTSRAASAPSSASCALAASR